MHYIYQILVSPNLSFTYSYTHVELNTKNWCSNWWMCNQTYALYTCNIHIVYTKSITLRRIYPCPAWLIMQPVMLSKIKSIELAHAKLCFQNEDSLSVLFSMHCMHANFN